MFTVIVKYSLPENINRSTLLATFHQAAPVFKSCPELIRKYFCYDADSHCGHSFYVWRDEASARGFFNQGFIEPMRMSFGSTPELLFVDALMVVDNVSDRTQPSKSRTKSDTQYSR